MIPIKFAPAGEKKSAPNGLSNKGENWRGFACLRYTFSLFKCAEVLFVTALQSIWEITAVCETL
jgi:hypothetical protein